MGQPPHHLSISKTSQPLSGLKKLEGNPEVPAELAAVMDVVNASVDNIETKTDEMITLPMCVAKFNADGTLSSQIGTGRIVTVDASVPGAYALTFEGPYQAGHAFVDVYAGNSFGEAVDIVPATGGITVNIRTAGVLTQQPFSVVIYRLA